MARRGLVLALCATVATVLLALGICAALVPHLRAHRAPKELAEAVVWGPLAASADLDCRMLTRDENQPRQQQVVARLSRWVSAEIRRIPLDPVAYYRVYNEGEGGRHGGCIDHWPGGPALRTGC